jgi:hypothetical protein
LPSPYLRRLIRSGRVVGSFVAVQAIVQIWQINKSRRRPSERW